MAQIICPGIGPNQCIKTPPIKTVTEYPLPAAAQTHEIVAASDRLLLVTQQTDGGLVKIALDEFGRPKEAKKYTIRSPYGGLHGLHLSKTYTKTVYDPNTQTDITLPLVWATLQFESKILLIDPNTEDVNSEPKCIPEREISLPFPARGPHGIVEDGKDLWITCKDSSHIVRINSGNPSNCTIYPCSRRPIFVAVRPKRTDYISVSEVYASLDESSKIWHRQGDGSTHEIDIPTNIGKTPVGLLKGPDGSIWVVLLGDSSSGTGAFGRIEEGDSCPITWFHLNTMAGMHAGLIHLAFDPRDESGSHLWLLGSSMANMGALNAVFSVKIGRNENGSVIPNMPKIDAQAVIALPSQPCMTHRVIAHPRHGLYVTELGACSVAHVTGKAVQGCIVRNPDESETCDEYNRSETYDQYSDFGQGCKGTHIEYCT